MKHILWPLKLTRAGTTKSCCATIFLAAGQFLDENPLELIPGCEGGVLPYISFWPWISRCRRRSAEVYEAILRSRLSSRLKKNCQIKVIQSPEHEVGEHRDRKDLGSIQSDLPFRPCLTIRCFLAWFSGHLGPAWTEALNYFRRKIQIWK